MNDMSAMAMPEEQAFEATMNAVIVYDDVAFASKAQAMLGQAAHRADAGLPWSLKPWRLELLILPPTAARALQDAAEAHLLVLAVRVRRIRRPGCWIGWSSGRAAGSFRTPRWRCSTVKAATCSPGPRHPSCPIRRASLV